MAKGPSIHAVIGSVGAVASTLALGVTVWATFFPNSLNNTTSQLIGQESRNAAGLLRPVYVSSQVTVFYVAVLFLIVLIGVALAASYYFGARRSAQSIAAGEGSKGWLQWLLPLPFILVCLLLGIFLPRAIFQPTDLDELGRQLFLAAWAVRSWLGGIVLGILLLVCALAVSYVAYLTAVTGPQRLVEARYKRLLAK